MKPAEDPALLWLPSPLFAMAPTAPGNAAFVEAVTELAPLPCDRQLPNISLIELRGD